MNFQNLLQRMRTALDVCKLFSPQVDAVVGLTLNCIVGIFLVRKNSLFVLYTL